MTRLPLRAVGAGERLNALAGRQDEGPTQFLSVRAVELPLGRTAQRAAGVSQPTIELIRLRGIGSRPAQIQMRRRGQGPRVARKRCAGWVKARRAVAEIRLYTQHG